MVTPKKNLQIEILYFLENKEREKGFFRILRRKR